MLMLQLPAACAAGTAVHEPRERSKSAPHAATQQQGQRVGGKAGDAQGVREGQWLWPQLRLWLCTASVHKHAFATYLLIHTVISYSQFGIGCTCACAIPAPSHRQ